MAKTGRGPQRTTKQDWLEKALELLIESGASSIKISTVAKKLECARSSFYWYFKNLDDLLNQILDYWQQINTNPIIEYAGFKSTTITEAVLHIFICWADETTFNTRLDFAVREWSRHSNTVKRLIKISDNVRINALRDMYLHHGYESRQALIRARTLYHSQIGYYAVDSQESYKERTEWVAEYVLCFTGKKATSLELDTYNNSMQQIYYN